MKNYDLERKIYRYKTITKYQEKAKMLGYQDTSKVVFSFLNKRLLFTFLLFCFVLLFSSYSYPVAPIVSILFYNLYAYFYFDYRIIERGKSLERDAIYFFEVLTLSLESGKNLVQSLKLTTSCIDSELSNEIKYALKEMEYGKSFYEAFTILRKKMPSDIIQNVILSITESYVSGESITSVSYTHLLFGDMETYNDTLHDFLNEVEGKLAKIKAYKENGDMANYAILVHSLKSDSKYFGFEKLAELAYNHEMESKANNMYYITDHFDELMMEANRIVALVKQYMGITTTNNSQTVRPLVIKDKTILVVDDSNVVRNFVYKIFNSEYDVLIANDGKEALDIIRANVDDKIVGMLLDLNMPNVDGFQVLDYFKQANLFARIPVAIITGEGTQSNIERAYQYPIVDMLQKPDVYKRQVPNILDI